MAEKQQIIYHMLEAKEWKACEGKEYYPKTFKQDGFTHATGEAKLLIKIANMFYKESKEEWICIAVDTNKLKAEVKWEAPAPVGNKKGDESEPKVLFPHIYGPIMHEDVVKVYPIVRSEQGEFLSIEGI
eukprot:CAMPEP_0167788712 /NCGR_PEP_ID=MMETSP0111_2-20121227/10201_1 /TAXON_ID=91324 /ORGANISM="Lotharella globosa, Strain CCCM811" /LENGTH=128 /DNA_ID=CAMNT_0007680637 /DNA_START=30 /DNA_END=416 /DNA_ORIENTATION=-